MDNVIFGFIDKNVFEKEINFEEDYDELTGLVKPPL